MTKAVREMILLRSLRNEQVEDFIWAGKIFFKLRKKVEGTAKN